MSLVDKYIKVKTRNYHPAVLIVWAALSAVAMLIPGIPTLGTGGTMSLTYPLAPISGILFGPLAGGIATTIGSIVGTLIAPASANLGIWTFLVQTGTAVVAGYISRGKWQVPTVILAIFTAWLYFLPTVRVVWWHGWIAVAGFLFSFVSAKWVCKWLKETNVVKLTVATFIVSLASFLVGIFVGDPLGIMIFDLQPELYYMLTWLMPLERVIFTVFTTILAVPLIVGLPKVKIFVGPRYDEDEVEEDEVDREMKDRVAK